MIEKFKNKKMSKWKLFLILVLVGNISFYFQERAKWIYNEQPYKEAKEWLVPANMMLVYGTMITKLPFVDERSFIMKPIIGLQDYFVSKWQEKLPNDDVEKYLAWYIFKLRSYIMNTSDGIILYGNKKYNFDEVISFNEKAWQTIEATVNYGSKDIEFNEIRYAAFNNLSALFVSNLTAYWIINTSESDYLTKDSSISLASMLKDKDKYQRLLKLYNWIYKMDELFKEKYSDIYYKSLKNEGAEYWINSRLHKLIKYIFFYQIKLGNYKETPDFCSQENNTYLRDYLSSKQWLLENEDFLKSKNISIEKTLSKTTDDLINSVCPKIKL